MNARGHWFVLLIPLGILVLIATGAGATSLRDLPDRATFLNVHIASAVAVAALAAIFFLWFAISGPRVSRIVISVLILAAGAFEAWIGTGKQLASGPATMGSLHALVSAVLFAP